jgi:hypothetical protein
MVPQAAMLNHYRPRETKETNHYGLVVEQCIELHVYYPSEVPLEQLLLTSYTLHDRKFEFGFDV